MSKPIEPYEIDELEHSADVLDVAIMASRKQMESLCVASPAFIMSYDRATQQVIAQPILRRRQNGKWVRRAPALSTPVLFPAGGGFAQTWDLKPGDFGFILHCDDDPQMWLHGGGKDSQGLFYDRNNRNYTFFLPAGRPFTSPLKSTEEGALWLGEDAYEGGGIVEEDARVGLRVKRGGEGGVELAREKEGEPTRRMGVTREGKIVIGDDANDLIGTIKMALEAIKLVPEMLPAATALEVAIGRLTELGE